MTGRLQTVAASAIAAIALIAAAGACSSGSHPAATPVTVFNLSADPGRDIPVTTPNRRVTMTAAHLRSTLDALLSEHVRLVAALVHDVSAKVDADASIQKLDANTQSLTNAIAILYGPAAARAFAQLWAQHTQFFVDYATAIRANSASGREEATGRLRDYQNDFASFLSTATGGGVQLVAVTSLLHGHVEDLIRYIEADVDGRSADAGAILTQAVAHVRVIANAVAKAIVAQHLAAVTR